MEKDSLRWFMRELFFNTSLADAGKLLLGFACAILLVILHGCATGPKL